MISCGENVASSWCQFDVECENDKCAQYLQSNESSFNWVIGEIPWPTHEQFDSVTICCTYKFWLFCISSSISIPICISICICNCNCISKTGCCGGQIHGIVFGCRLRIWPFLVSFQDERTDKTNSREKTYWKKLFFWQRHNIDINWPQIVVSWKNRPLCFEKTWLSFLNLSARLIFGNF